MALLLLFPVALAGSAQAGRRISNSSSSMIIVVSDSSHGCHGCCYFCYEYEDFC